MVPKWDGAWRKAVFGSTDLATTPSPNQRETFQWRISLLKPPMVFYGCKMSLHWRVYGGRWGCRGSLHRPHTSLICSCRVDVPHSSQELLPLYQTKGSKCARVPPPPFLPVWRVNLSGCLRQEGQSCGGGIVLLGDANGYCAWALMKR